MNEVDILKKQIKIAGKKKPPRRVPVVREPRHLEARLRKVYTGILLKVKKRLRDQLLTIYRTDSKEDDLREASNFIRIELGSIVDDATADIVDITEKIEEYNNTKFKDQMRRSLGIDIFLNEPELSERLRTFSLRNAQLIKDASEEMIKEVSTRAFVNVSQGVRAKDLSDFIEQRFEVKKSRAKLIARDQTSKLTSQLNKSRQEALGVTHYIWRTSNDERVRASHESFDGNPYSYKEGSPEGHPGEPIQCRCHAEPLLDHLFD